MRTLVAITSALLLATPVAAQQRATAAQSAPTPAQGEWHDRVVAVVGDTVLLQSDVEIAVRQAEASGMTLPTDPAQLDAFRTQLLQRQIDDLILVEAAKQANTQVNENDINQQVDSDIQAVMQRYGTEPAFETALAQEGMTRTQYRQMLFQQYRDQQMVVDFERQRLANRARPLISEDQLRQAFETQRASLGQRPVRVTLQQVIVKPEPDDSARARALRTAQDVMKQLQAGGNFDVLAKRYSDDPGTKEQGGDLGWFAPDKMVKEFANAVYAMSPGQTIGPVKTDFGYHIIRLERISGAQRKARHILIRPEITPEDVQRARTRADSVATAIRGGASPTVLARAYGTSPSDAEVTRIPVDQLPTVYTQLVQNATAGQVLGPVEVPGAGESSYAVVKVVERQEAGAYTLEDVRDQLLQNLQQQQMIDDLVKELRKQMYVQVMM